MTLFLGSHTSYNLSHLEWDSAKKNLAFCVETIFFVNMSKLSW